LGFISDAKKALVPEIPDEYLEYSKRWRFMASRGQCP
jgi:hypothetical protein